MNERHYGVAMLGWVPTHSLRLSLILPMAAYTK